MGVVEEYPEWSTKLGQRVFETGTNVYDSWLSHESRPLV